MNHPSHHHQQRQSEEVDDLLESLLRSNGDNHHHYVHPHSSSGATSGPAAAPRPKRTFSFNNLHHQHQHGYNHNGDQSARNEGDTHISYLNNDNSSFNDNNNSSLGCQNGGEGKTTKPGGKRRKGGKKNSPTSFDNNDNSSGGVAVPTTFLQYPVDHPATLSDSSNSLNNNSKIPTSPAAAAANSTSLKDVEMLLERLAPSVEAPMLADIDPSKLNKSTLLTVDENMRQTRIFFKDILKLIVNIVSLMSVARVFASEVGHSSRVALVGKTNFEISLAILSYFPLAFTLLIVPRYFTLRSHLLWNEYLLRGVIVDFPPSQSFPFLFSNVRPMMFILFTTLYCGFALFVFSLYGASNSILLLFFKLIAIDITMSWYSWQTVEKGLLSLSRYIEAFDDRNLPQGPTIDPYTCTKAAQHLPTLRPAQSMCSYLGYTDRYGINRLRDAAMYKWVVRFCGIGIAVSLSVISFYYFQIISQNDVKALWVNNIGQCARVCFDAVERNAARCFWCACNCATTAGAVWDPKACESYLLMPGCNTTVMCALEGNASDPDAICIA